MLALRAAPIQVYHPPLLCPPLRPSAVRQKQKICTRRRVIYAQGSYTIFIKIHSNIYGRALSVLLSSGLRLPPNRRPRLHLRFLNKHNYSETARTRVFSVENRIIRERCTVNEYLNAVYFSGKHRKPGALGF